MSVALHDKFITIGNLLFCNCISIAQRLKIQLLDDL